VSIVVGGLIAGALYTLVALGLILIIRVTGAINFAQGDVGSAGTFVTIFLVGKGVGWPVAWAVVVGLVCGAAVNALIYLLLIRRLERASADSLATMVVTIGCSLVIEAILTLKFGFNPYGLQLFTNFGLLHIGGVRVPGSGVMIIATALVALLVFAVVLYRTKIGLILRMGSSNPRLAELRGVRIVLVRLVVWIVAGIMSTWGVLLYSSYQSISTSVMSGFLLTAAVAASWGAFRSLTLTLVGAVSLGIVLNVVTRFVQTDISYIITLGVLIVVFLVYQFRRGSLETRIDAAPSGAVRSRLAAKVRAAYRLRPRVAVIEVALIAIGLIVWTVLSDAYQSALVVEVAVAIAVLAGLTVILRYGRRLTLGAGGYLGISAYVFGVLAPKIGGWEAALCAVAACFVLGCVIGAVTSGMQLMFYTTLTLVFTVAVPQLVDLLEKYTGGEQGFYLSDTGGLPTSAWFAVVVAVVVVAAVLLFGLSRLGSATLVASGDVRLAKSNGLPHFWYLVNAEGIGAACIGVGGVLYALGAGYLDPPTFNLTLSIGYVAALVVGGGWAAVGLLLGALFYVLVPAQLATLPNYPQIVYGCVLILAVLFAPVGLEGLANVTYLRGRPAAAGRARERRPPPAEWQDVVRQAAPTTGGQS
jgi:branched-subunit amino acid ABC-type transport system permease component